MTDRHFINTKRNGRFFSLWYVDVACSSCEISCFYVVYGPDGIPQLYLLSMDTKV